MGFLNLHLVHDSCSAAMLILLPNIRGGHFILHHFDLAAFLTQKYTVRISSLLILGFRFSNSLYSYVGSFIENRRNPRKRLAMLRGDLLHSLRCIAVEP